jgi:hypothetical protein
MSTETLEISPDHTLTQGQIIRLSIATSLIEAMGGNSVMDAEAIAAAVTTIAKVVDGR